jgi:four helix bundle protein
MGVWEYGCRPDLRYLPKEEGMSFAQHHRELRVFQMGFEASMKIFENSKKWPSEEKYSLTDQIRRSSRSVCANIAEAWRKRRYVAQFVNKLSDSDAEAAETQVWLDFAVACEYMDRKTYDELYQVYEQVARGLVKMMANPEAWCGPAVLCEEPATYDTKYPSADLDADGL